MGWMRNVVQLLRSQQNRNILNKRLDRRKNYLSKKRSNLKNEYNQIKDIPKLFYQSKLFFRAFKLEGYGFQLENVHVLAELLGVFNGE